MRFRAVLDPSAVAAYCAGSEHVGEVLREIADEHARVAVPVVALIEADMPAKDRALLDVLAGLPYVETLPLPVEGWGQVRAATELLGGLGRACAALLVVTGEAGYVMSAEPEVYGDSVETIAV